MHMTPSATRCISGLLAPGLARYPHRHEVPWSNEALATALPRWMFGKPLSALSIPTGAAPALQKILFAGLGARELEAITQALFTRQIHEKLGAGAAIESSVRRIISAEYTAHYLRATGGDIATGISGYWYSTSWPSSSLTRTSDCSTPYLTRLASVKSYGRRGSCEELGGSVFFRHAAKMIMHSSSTRCDGSSR